MATPGKMIACCPSVKTPKPLLKASVSIAPHSGWGGWAPRPRKERAGRSRRAGGGGGGGGGGWAPRPRKGWAATSRMAVAEARVVCTIRGAKLFGRIAEKTICESEAAIA